MSEQSNSNRRHFKNVLVRPQRQLKMSFLLISVGMIAMILLIAMGAFSMQRTLQTLQVIYHLDEEIVGMAWSSLLMSFGLIVVLAIIMGVIAFILSIKLTHRIFGPIVAIRAHIDQLKSGNYASRVRLRKGDELVEISDALNELAEHFEKVAGK